MPADSSQIKQVLDQTLAWSAGEGYMEWTKHDALNSPLLFALFGHHRLGRILATQAVMRFPINLRPLLGVPKSHNPKGLALFVIAFFDAFAATGEENYLNEANKLLDQLLALRSRGNWHGDCWGYQYPWQDLGFYAPRATPNAVVTAFACEAFLHAFRITGDEIHLARVESAVRFFVNDLAVLKDADEELCVGYMPLPMTMRVMDVSILIAAVLAQLSAIRGDMALRDTALRLTRYVVNRQTSEGAWYYTDPPEDSPVKIDNYHTGFIVDALNRVMVALKIDTWRNQHRLGVDFYAAHLFNPDGSPRWMSNRDYPHDIHGAAQGILTFSSKENRARYPRLAFRVIDWAFARMYHAEGRFYYQETPYGVKKFTFVRWCNAWMCRALASYLLSVAHEKN
jgi:hypothetical protein